jgi:thiol-disulfide isomerase/thioredoxin
MKIKRYMMAAVLAAGVVWNLAGAAEPDTAKLKQEIETLWRLGKSQPGDKNARIAQNSAIVEGCEKLLKEYAGLPRTDEQRDILSRVIMLDATERLYNDAPTAENRKKLCAVAEDVVTLPVHDASVWGERRKPVAASKARAGKLLAMANIYETPAAAPKDAAKHIRAMLELFPDKAEIKGSGETRKQALVYALQLALKTGEKELTQELGAAVAKKCLDTKYALDTLMEAGYPVAFEDETTLLSGEKISFPQDVKGKIVVLDFWATWCGPCKASMPHLKAIHEKYKDRGVLVIGICCDAPAKGEIPEACKKRVADFLAENKYDWTQVFSGNWPASAAKYGVASIPSVFVLDRQGNIVSAQARGQEERLIEQELAKAAAKK